MTNIEKLKTIGILMDVRLRMGEYNEDEDSLDAKINTITNKELVAKWTVWNLGSESWGKTIIGLYEGLNEFDKSSEEAYKTNR